MRHLSTVLLIVLTAAGCNPRPLFLQPRPMREWPPTLRAVQEAARAGRYAEADSALARFVERNRGSYESREALYWRALLRVDPANPQSSAADALRSINELFATGATVDTYDEANILRRVVQRMDSLNRTLAQAERLIAEAQEAAEESRPAAPAPAPAAPAAAPAERREREQTRANRNLVEQVRRLREELSKSNQELERVRRRLSEPRP
jgi:hypothetical protein